MCPFPPRHCWPGLRQLLPGSRFRRGRVRDLHQLLRLPPQRLCHRHRSLRLQTLPFHPRLRLPLNDARDGKRLNRPHVALYGGEYRLMVKAEI